MHPFVRAQNIVSLVLAGNPLTDEGVVRLATALRTNCALVELNLVEIECRNRGVSALADALAANTTLRRIWLRSHDMEVACMARLARVALAARGGSVRWELFDLCLQYAKIVKAVPLARLAEDGAAVLGTWSDEAIITSSTANISITHAYSSKTKENDGRESETISPFFGERMCKSVFNQSI